MSAGQLVLEARLLPLQPGQGGANARQVIRAGGEHVYEVADPPSSLAKLSLQVWDGFSRGPGGLEAVPERPLEQVAVQDGVKALLHTVEDGRLQVVHRHAQRLRPPRPRRRLPAGPVAPPLLAAER